MRILVTIMSHNTENPIFINHKNVWDKIIEYSIKNDYPIDYLFLYSDEHLKNNYVIQENKLISKCEENYWDSLLIKSFNGFEYFYNSNYDLTFKTNLSTIINLTKFFEACKNIDLNRKYIYDGFIGYYNDYKFVSGAGMLLNKNSVDLILKNKNEISQSWTDDIFFGYILNKKYNITPHYGDLTRYDIINNNQIINFENIKQSTHTRIKIRINNQDIKYTNLVYEYLYI